MDEQLGFGYAAVQRSGSGRGSDGRGIPRNGSVARTAGRTGSPVTRARDRSVDGRVALDSECLDRIYACPTWTSSRPEPAPPTGVCWKPNVSARAPSLRAQPLSGSCTPHRRGGVEDPGPAVRPSSGNGPSRRLVPDAARRDRLHQQEPARLDSRVARQRVHPRAK